jgi:uncharacterized protein (DUF58 family)
MEIEGFRRYKPGDDLRFLDWPTYLRAGELLIRQFRQERSVDLSLLLDTSRSMAVPERDGKFPFALRTAALLSYVALANGDAVRVVPFAGTDPAPRPSPVLRTRAGFLRVWRLLGDLDAQGETALLAAVTRHLGDASARGGLAVLVSDLLLPADELDEALGKLRGADHEVVAIRVSGGREPHLPARPGAYRLRDAESGRTLVVWLSRGEVRRRAERAGRHEEAVRALLRRHRVRAVDAAADESAERFLFRALPHLGLIR